LNLGGGFSDFGKSCSVPSPCFNCKDVFELNIFSKKHLCPKCRRKSSPFGEITTTPSPNPLVFEWGINFEDSSTYELEDKKYTCPVCMEEELTFEVSGCWD
jgi:Zn finger protein HypA/HybF involved in hydrogenase expression